LARANRTSTRYTCGGGRIVKSMQTKSHLGEDPCVFDDGFNCKNT
jgi:hypothetical protein